MASERENFNLSGPLYLTTIDWQNPHHRRSVAASLVQGVYILEKDRQQKRWGTQSLANPWWDFFNFQLLEQLVDDTDSSIFGAIFEYKSPPEKNFPTNGSPHFVIAFRGTINKKNSLSRDLTLDLHFIQNKLHQSSRFEIAIQAVRKMVATFRGKNIWLAGHSLGSAMALLAGKDMARAGIFLESFLFNSPFLSAPLERIKHKKVKHGIRIASSFITAGLAAALKGARQSNMSEDPFAALASWFPSLFVNPSDPICSEYVGYFEHRKKMEKIGASGIEKVATQNSIGALLMNAFGKGSEPLHLIPSASLTINWSHNQDFKQAHGIHQWWRPDLNLETKLFKY